MASTEEFYQFIRSYSLEDSLIFIGQIAYQIFQNTEEFQNSAIGHHVPRNINLWQLAFLAKSLIMNSNDYRKGKKLDTSELFKCANLFNNLDEPLFENDKTIENAYSAILRLSYQQFPYQQSLRNDLVRAFFT